MEEEKQLQQKLINIIAFTVPSGSQDLNPNVSDAEPEFLTTIKHTAILSIPSSPYISCPATAPLTQKMTLIPT